MLSFPPVADRKHYWDVLHPFFLHSTSLNLVCFTLRVQVSSNQPHCKYSEATSGCSVGQGEYKRVLSWGRWVWTGPYPSPPGPSCIFPSLPSSHTNLMIPQTRQAHTHLTVFACMTPSFWNVLSMAILLIADSFSQAFLDHLIWMDHTSSESLLYLFPLRHHCHPQLPYLSIHLFNACLPQLE